VGRLGTCPYWYGVGRLETCPYWYGVGRLETCPYWYGVGRLETCPYWCGVDRLETCPYWCGVDRLETCPPRCGNGREGEGGDAIPPSSPRGGEEGEQGKSEGRRRQPTRARLRKTAGGQVRNLPLLVRGGQVGNLPLLVRGGQVGNLPLLVRPGGRLETCPYRCGNGREGEGAMLSPLPLPVEERKGSRGKVKADADNPHAPVYARRPVGRLGTCPYWYGVGRLETCPYWYGRWAG
jgi:hypothetical protein